MGRWKQVYLVKERDLEAERERGDLDLDLAGDLREGFALGDLLHYSCKVNMQLLHHK